MPTLHEYPVSLEWSGGREGHGAAVAENSGTTFNLAVGAEFQGTGEGTNPEELLTTAIAACYSITFGIVAANRKLPVTDIDVSATGVVEQNGVNLVYTSITIRPAITLDAGASDEQVAAAEDLAHKADNYCLITNAVRGKVAVSVQPTIVRG